nr:hypothetical protein [Haloquadratum walsbyi]
MTTFEDLERGDIAWASDPLSEKGRPMLILGAPNLPNHGTQLITVLLSTKTYHEEALTLRDDGLPRYPPARNGRRARVRRRRGQARSS